MEIKKAIFSHFLLFLSIFGSIWGFFGAQNLTCSQSAAGTPIVMILSQDDPGLYRKLRATDDPMYETFIQALDGHVTIVMSTPVLYWLTKRVNEQRGGTAWTSKLQNDFVLYLVKEDGFVLIVPKEQKDDLASLGINADYISEPLTTFASIKTRLSNPKYGHQAIDSEQIANLFVKNSYFHSAPPKYWYITGHGLDSIDDAKFKWCKATVAEQPIYALVNMLEVLNKINTKAVYLLSCYCAGSNALALQNILSGTVSDERCACIDELTFSLLFQSSGDLVDSNIIQNFPAFFTAMQECDWDDAKSVAHKLNDQFMQATPQIKRFANYPMMRTPKNHCFQALELPSTIVFSEPVTTAQTIDAPAEKEMIQIYPADLSQLTINMRASQPAFIISRVIGRSHHFIGSITTKATGDITDLIGSSMLSGVILAGTDEFYAGVSDKAWFIDTVKIANKDEIQGLVVFKGSLKHANRIATAVYRTAANEYYRITIPLPFERQKFNKEPIDEQTYCKTVKEIYWQTIPEDDALAEATNNSENHANHQSLLTSFGSKLSIQLSEPLDDEMIRNDFAAIKSQKIAKDNYINYTAHCHDEAIIDAIVDDGINDDIFDAQDITLLLCKLIDHEYHSLICKQVHKLAEQNDPKILHCVIHALRHLLDAGLYKQALHQYDDIFVIFKKALARDRCDYDLLADIEQQLIQLVTALAQHNCAADAAEKICELLEASDISMQGLGLVLLAAMENAGCTESPLNEKRSLVRAAADNLIKSAQSYDPIALYFYNQDLAQQSIERA